ncbi:putative membrane protein [Clostridium acetobutylicum]|nr:putative membrane protein [Clostridium acetobutylicum]
MILLTKITLLLFSSIFFSYILYMKSHSFKKIEPRKCSLNLMIIGMAFIVVGEFLNFISSFVKYRVDIYVSFCFILGAILFVIFAIIFLNSVDNTLKCPLRLCI